ncbi:hypothetical protein LPJ73_002107 [Coemansia sp. RSA 2703]|nr:hypothetical protein LPJ73_002107 [Coemansia sp. RSA 2703]KAJ2377816.1 hypothetical protein IW150_001166 [Coemansia sp. RSA 2607]KAJ2392542.1 hypothetical protein GGI05_002645 [Coemansia sp. RSA 2603]
MRRSARILEKTASEVSAASSQSSPAKAKARVAVVKTSKVTKKKTEPKTKAKVDPKVLKEKTAVVVSSTVIKAKAPVLVAVPRAPLNLNAGTIVHLGTQEALNAAVEYLKAADPKLGKFIDTVSEPCSLVLARDRSDHTSYVSLCQSVIYQQLAGKAAAAILLRFLKRYGELKDSSKAGILETDDGSLTSDDFIFPPAAYVATLDVDEMKAVGLGQRKAEYLKEVARQFNIGNLSDEKLANMTDEEASQALVSIRGIGQWTADMFLMFHLKRPNILPTLDLAIRKAMCHHFGVPFGKKTPTHEQMIEMGTVWEPYRSVATWYMWRLLGTITQKS